MTEFDNTATVSNIVDGDTFDVTSGHRIRLADIDTPEQGEFGYLEAGRYLEDKINMKKVYLDIDDVYRYDYEGTGNRLVCLVYVPHNSTHYLNVNKALLVSRHAVIYEFNNEFTPSEWTLYTPIIQVFTFYEIQVLSGATALVLTAILYLMYRKLHRFTKNILETIKTKVGYKPNQSETEA